MREETTTRYYCSKCNEGFLDKESCEQHEAQCHARKVRLGRYRMDLTRSGDDFNVETTFQHIPETTTEREFPDTDKSFNFRYIVLFEEGKHRLSDIIETVKNDVLANLVRLSKLVSEATEDNINNITPVTREEFDRNVARAEAGEGDPMGPEEGLIGRSIPFERPTPITAARIDRAIFRR